MTHDADSSVAVNILSMFQRIDLATVTGKKQYKVGELEVALEDYLKWSRCGVIFVNGEGKDLGVAVCSGSAWPSKSCLKFGITFPSE